MLLHNTSIHISRSFLLACLLHLLLFFSFGSAIFIKQNIAPQLATSINFKVSTSNAVNNAVAINSKALLPQNSSKNASKNSNNIANNNFSANTNSDRNNPSLNTEPDFNAAYLNNPAPEYPDIAKQMGIEGTVLLLVLVQENGLPAQVSIKQSSGSSLLDKAAINAVKNWKFVAAQRYGNNIVANVIVPIKFQLS